MINRLENRRMSCLRRERQRLKNQFGVIKEGGIIGRDVSDNVA